MDAVTARDCPHGHVRRRKSNICDAQDYAEALAVTEVKHADFVRRVRETGDEIIGSSEIGSRAERLAEKIIAMCDAECEK